MSPRKPKARSTASRNRAPKPAAKARHRRFWRALGGSALASFLAASGVLHAPWLQRLELWPTLEILEPLQRHARVLREPAQWAHELLLAIWQPPQDGGADWGSLASSFSGCPELFPHDTPPALLRPRGQLRELCFERFAVLHSGATKTPVYVVERLNRASVLAAQSVERSDRFYPEARLPSRERAQLDDYRNSGYARGHMAPAGDMPNPQAMEQSFSLANTVPQNPNHNSGAWSKIEQDTRKYVLRARGDVYVFTGPAYADGANRAIGASRVAVPSHLFKLVYDSASGRSWAYWQQNAAGQQPLRPMAYRELVQRVGIEFLPPRVGREEAADTPQADGHARRRQGAFTALARRGWQDSLAALPPSGRVLPRIFQQTLR